MSVNARRIGTLAAAVALCAVTATPAHADHDYKCSTNVGGPDAITYCIVEAHDNYVHGQVAYNAMHGVTHSFSGTMVVEQCSGLGTNCATITAARFSVTSTAGYYSAWAYTTNKPSAFGHTYRTCVSGTSTVGTSWTYVCTAFNAYTP